MKLILPSRISSIDAVESFVNELSNRYAISSELYGNILTSLTEAVTNAIVHGNDCQYDKDVSVNVDVSCNCVSLTISDEGEGFSPENLPDPTCPSRLLQEGGRGVFLMHALSDDIGFSNGGRVVRMDFNYTPIRPIRTKRENSESLLSA